jgi:hypothetical protein
MSSISVYLESTSPEVSQLAHKLGGACAEELPIRDGIEQVFNFGLESMATQFHLSVLHFPEVISVGRSPIRQAIAASRLCDCGWTTKQECDRECETPNGLEVNRNG